MVRIVTDEWVQEIERESEANKKALENMVKAHERCLNSYYELRDSKDQEIMRLHQEIEYLKKELANVRAESDRRRQAVLYYEAVLDGKAAV